MPVVMAEARPQGDLILLVTWPCWEGVPLQFLPLLETLAHGCSKSFPKNPPQRPIKELVIPYASSFVRGWLTATYRTCALCTTKVEFSTPMIHKRSFTA